MNVKTEVDVQNGDYLGKKMKEAAWLGMPKKSI